MPAQIPSTFLPRLNHGYQAVLAVVIKANKAPLLALEIPEDELEDC